MARANINRENLLQLLEDIVDTDIDAEGFELLPLPCGGEVAGVLMIKGNEVHVGIKPEYHGRWFQKWAISVLFGLLEQHGSLVTTVRKTNENGQRFVSRLGFKQTGETDHLFEYELKS